MNTFDSAKPSAQPAMVQGYPRAAIDDFLAAAARERRRLRDELAAASARVERANLALGMHRTMIAMLIDTGRDLQDLRHRTEVMAAQQFSPDTVSAATGVAPSVPSTVSVPFGVPESIAPESMAPESISSAPSPLSRRPRLPRRNRFREDDEEYFGFLRGALSDDEPLGPRPE